MAGAMGVGHESRSLFLLLLRLLRLQPAPLRRFSCYSNLPHARGVSRAGVSYLHVAYLACETYAKHKKRRNDAA